MEKVLQGEWTKDEPEFPQVLAGHRHAHIAGATTSSGNTQIESMGCSDSSWQTRAHPCLRIAVERVLRHCHGDRHQAAQAIGVDVETLNAWLLH